MGLAYGTVTADSGENCEFTLDGVQGKETIELPKSEIKFVKGRTYIPVTKLGGSQQGMDLHVHVRLPKSAKNGTRTAWIKKVHYKGE
jgi:hypothetical protein